MSKQIIGFATEFYTLWDYNTEDLYTTDAYGNHHHTGIKHNYYYLQNISKDLETVKSKYPNLSIDDGLRGRRRSFDRTERIEMPAEYLPFGKYQGKLISDVASSDLKYLVWFLENGPKRTTDLIKELPEIKAYFEQQEREERERYGKLLLLESGKQMVTISTNGLSGFHIPDRQFEEYSGKPYMVAVLRNEQGYYTYVKIILDDVKRVDGIYPYLMPVINGKAMKTKNKTLALDLRIIATWKGLSEATQVAVLIS